MHVSGSESYEYVRGHSDSGTRPDLRSNALGSTLGSLHTCHYAQWRARLRGRHCAATRTIRTLADAVFYIYPCIISLIGRRLGGAASEQRNDEAMRARTFVLQLVQLDLRRSADYSSELRHICRKSSLELRSG